MSITKFRYIKPEFFTYPIPFDEVGKSLITSTLLEYLCILRSKLTVKNIARDEIITMGDEVHRCLSRIYATLERTGSARFYKIKTSYHSEAFAMFLFIAQDRAFLVGRNYFGYITLGDSLNPVFDPYSDIHFKKMGTFAPIFDEEALQEDNPRISFYLDSASKPNTVEKTLKEIILDIIVG